MQSFKHFLSEEIEHGRYFNYTLKVERLNNSNILQNVPKEKWEDLAESISPLLKCQWFLDFTVNLVIANPTQQQMADYTWFENIETKLEEGADELLKPTILTFDKQKSYGKLEYYGVPMSLIDYKVIKLFFNTRSLALSGFNKMIGKNCVQLDISNMDFVQSNVLSLLLLPKTCKIKCNTIKEPWVKIVDKHLQCDRDILECQEELITNGLRQYAKL